MTKANPAARIRRVEQRQAGIVALALDAESKRVRVAVVKGLCPVCGMGPYRLLGGHTAQAHGLTADELRDMALLPRSVGLCDQELADRQRELAHLKGLGHMPGADGARAHGVGSTKTRRARLADALVGERNAKPHSCPVCGRMIPRSAPVTCSEECRSARLGARPPRKACSEAGCDRVHVARGLCTLHYQRAKRASALEIETRG